MSQLDKVKTYILYANSRCFLVFYIVWLIDYILR